MTATRQKKKDLLLRVGDRIWYGKGDHPWPGLVIEDRGDLGVGGRQVVGVRIFHEVLGTYIHRDIELPAASFRRRAKRLPCDPPPARRQTWLPRSKHRKSA